MKTSFKFLARCILIKAAVSKARSLGDLKFSKIELEPDGFQHTRTVPIDVASLDCLVFTTCTCFQLQPYLL